MLKSPFPYFGNKDPVVEVIWEALGDVSLFVEAFAGSLAALRGRPHPPKQETVNDLDGHICNVWRSLKWAPNEMARWAEWPINELDLRARHQWLIARTPNLVRELESDPDYCDPKAAGWWCWGASCWIGDGWCESYSKKIPNIDGKGSKGVVASGQGNLEEWFTALHLRLKKVKVVCGDWSRVVTPTALRTAGGPRGVLFDPPYTKGNQQYSAGGTGSPLASGVRGWCKEHSLDPGLRIVLCGRGEEHQELEALGWKVVPWSAKGGYALEETKDLRHSEKLWLSPHCLEVGQAQVLDLFD
jgi:DNA adenine methylase